MDFKLTEEQQMLQDTAARLVRDVETRLQAIKQEHDDEKDALARLTEFIRHFREQIRSELR